MGQTNLLNWSRIEYASRESIIAWIWKSVTDKRTNKQTNKHTNLCIELRYAQLIKRQQARPGDIQRTAAIIRFLVTSFFLVVFREFDWMVGDNMLIEGLVTGQTCLGLRNPLYPILYYKFCSDRGIRHDCRLGHLSLNAGWIRKNKINDFLFTTLHSISDFEKPFKFGKNFETKIFLLFA